ncbi:methyltransferase [uncultured Alistipes sp.]|uniref:tRNA1(Val) (adenine(37)-N6)-methyltransferase n=1 Tax=uncultured Alistipes sp. TaxID=538949 RepID=UPI00261CE6C8|nr:methyltransferase [uncultured Alistipes sp.]
MFQFKRFTIRQDRCAMKVGTDGVLLGAWASVRPGDRLLLDIGTGTGLVALMLAQRSEACAADGAAARIVGVDIEPVEQARENAAASPWADRLSFERTAVQAYDPGVRFDLVLSNPPFFVDSLTCPDRGRTMARHAVSLPFEELRDAAVRLLAPSGRFAVILPTDEGERFEALCRGVLTLRRRTRVRTVPRREPKRVLLEFVPAAGMAEEPVDETLSIGTGGHESYTDEYRALTRDFYLKF